MTTEEKVTQLKGVIDRELIPLIDRNYVLYGMPTYTNVGDTLIWKGELAFLRKVKHRCLGKCAWDKYPDQELSEDTIVLITGGGYFGDVWRLGWQYVLDGIKRFKRNKIIIFPCSVWYDNIEICHRDVQYLNEFKNLIICARDRQSYDYVKRHFNARALLVPDMAFYVKKKVIRRYAQPASEKSLYLRRDDHELVRELNYKIRAQYDESDWITLYDTATVSQRRFALVVSKINIAVIRKLITRQFADWLIEKLYFLWYGTVIASEGIRFLSGYNCIYTTRLHGLILAVLLNREVYFIDNSYGKIGATVKTWLSDLDNVYETKDINCSARI
jgi:pyruvyl transferase EpsO